MALRQVPPELLAESFESDYRHRPHQRQTVRRYLLLPIRLWVPGDDTPREAALRNISDGGAFVEHDPLPVNTVLRIELAQGNQVEVREAEVVWVERSDLATRVRSVRGFGVRFLTAKSAG